MLAGRAVSSDILVGAFPVRPPEWRDEETLLRSARADLCSARPQGIRRDRCAAPPFGAAHSGAVPPGRHRLYGGGGVNCRPVGSRRLTSPGHHLLARCAPFAPAKCGRRARCRSLRGPRPPEPPGQALAGPSPGREPTHRRRGRCVALRGPSGVDGQQ